jgi:hypothetical protein
MFRCGLKGFIHNEMSKEVSSSIDIVRLTRRTLPLLLFLSTLSLILPGVIRDDPTQKSIASQR